MKRNDKQPLIRNIIKVLPVFVAVVAMAYLVVAVKDMEIATVLPVDKFQVHGDVRFLDKEEIKEIVEANIDGGFFTVDLNQVREVLLQKPWMKNVSLRRHWPDTVDVFVEERQAIAYWNQDGYISDSGHVFKPETIVKDMNLPFLSGPQGQHNNVWRFMNVLYKEMVALNYSVTSLELDARRAWRMEIVNNQKASEGEAKTINVRLGRFDTQKRMQRFIRILPALATKKAFSENEIEVIDMRYPNGFAVKMTTDGVTTINKKNTAGKLVAANEYVDETHLAVVQMGEA